MRTSKHWRRKRQICVILDAEAPAPVIKWPWWPHVCSKSSPKDRKSVQKVAPSTHVRPEGSPKDPPKFPMGCQGVPWSRTEARKSLEMYQCGEPGAKTKTCKFPRVFVKPFSPPNTTNTTQF